MIQIELNRTELAAGLQAIDEFNDELEEAWMPGFSRSYDRRQEAYLKAYQRYEQRGLFLRLLFRKPKQPQRPPVGYGEQAAVRLRQDWLASLVPAASPAGSASKKGQAATVTGIQALLDFLSGFLDDRFFALANPQIDPSLSADLLLAGPSGIWLFVVDDKHGRLPTSEPDSNPHLSSLVSWSRIAEAIGASLQSTAQLDPAATATLLPLKGGVVINTGHEQSQLKTESPNGVRAGRHADYRRWLGAPSNGHDIEQLTILQILDGLLSRQQELQHLATVSALATAQKLMKREKDSLLRMAATL